MRRVLVLLIFLGMPGCGAPRKPARWRFVYSGQKPAADCVPFDESMDRVSEWVCPNPDWKPDAKKGKP